MLHIAALNSSAFKKNEREKICIILLTKPIWEMKLNEIIEVIFSFTENLKELMSGRLELTSSIYNLEVNITDIVTC